MGLLNKLFGKKPGGIEKEIGSQDVIEAMLANAGILLEEGLPEKAFSIYKQIVQLQPEATAQYNLGSLCAQGLGTEQNFLEGAYWFQQAAEAGDEKAKKLQTKCMLDYMHQGLADNTPRDVFEKMFRYASYIYPQDNSTLTANGKIFAIAEYHMSKKEYAVAAKLFRAAAEFGNDGQSQNYLGVLYNAGAGVEKNDLVSLYWFDRAVDNQIEAAKTDRNGILNAYRANFSPSDFGDQMEILASFCTAGTENIPKDAEKAAYWRKHIQTSV